MRINTSKSKIMILNQKRVESPLRVWEEPLPQLEEYLGFCSQLREYWRLRLGNQIGVASTVMQTLYWYVVVKRKLSRKPKLSICLTNYILTLNYGYELRLVAERMKIMDTLCEMSFLEKLTALSHIDKMRSLDIKEWLVELLLLHIERNSWGGTWLGCLLGEVIWTCDTRRRHPQCPMVRLFLSSGLGTTQCFPGQAGKQW